MITGTVTGKVLSASVLSKTGSLAAPAAQGGRPEYRASMLPPSARARRLVRRRVRAGRRQRPMVLSAQWCARACAQCVRAWLHFMEGRHLSACAARRRRRRAALLAPPARARA
eukprot:7067782-Prymnesium_polylepis.1